MKQNSVLFIWGLILSLSSCIGTDEVEDTISSISIRPPENVTLVNEGNFAKVLGQEVNLIVEARSDLGGNFIPNPEALDWSSSDESIVTVDDEGLVSAVGVGTATITVGFQAEGSAAVSDAIEVSVAGDAEAIVLIEITTPDNLFVIEPGSEVSLSGRLLNAAGNEVNSTSNLVWSSSNESVATVSQVGLVTAISDGEVRISASSETASGFIDLTVADASSLTRTAEFRGLSGYDASGEAILEQSPGGEITLKLLSDFKAQNGPGLYLYLSNNATQVGGGIEIEMLQSTSGEQEYSVPSNVTLDQFDHVVLYCKPFGVGFGTAELSK